MSTTHLESNSVCFTTEIHVKHKYSNKQINNKISRYCTVNGNVSKNVNMMISRLAVLAIKVFVGLVPCTKLCILVTGPGSKMKTCSIELFDRNSTGYL